MLSEEIIEKLTERLVQRITNANLFVIKKIAKKIKEMGTIQPSNSFDVMNMLNYGGDLDKITKEIAKETELNVKDIYKIFEEVAKDDQNFAKQFYKYRNKKFIPWKDNEFLRREVDALAELTANNYVNMAKTSGVGYTVRDNEGNTIFKDISTLYKDMVDDGLVSLSQGKTSFDEEMGRLMKQIAMSGLKYVEYESGHTRRLDSALRMNLNDGLKKLHNKSQEIFGREFGADGVEVSVHNNPAPDHEQVQGRQFSTIRPSESELSEWEKFENDQDCKSYDGIEFPAVSEETGRDRRSISEYNCKHHTFAIVLGVSKPQYTNEQLQAIIDKNEEGFEFEGKHYTMYEGTQLQRKIETQIRKNMDLQVMGKESGRDDLVQDAQRNIDQLTNKYYELSQVSGLSTKLERMQVPGYREAKLVDNTPPSNKINARELIVEQPKIDYEEEFGILTKDLEKNGVSISNNIYNFKDEQLRNKNLNQLLELSNKYPHNIVRNKNLTLNTSSRDDNNYGSAYYEEHEIRLNANHYLNTSKVVEAEKKNMESGWHYKVSEDKADIYTITHEYGHIVEYEYLREARENARRSGRRFNFKEKDKELRDTLISRAITIAGKKMNTQYFKDKYFSGYAKSKRNYEWFAELFAQSQLGEQTPFAQALLEWLEVRYK